MLRRTCLAGPVALTLLAAAGAALAQGAQPGAPNARVACRASALSLCRPEIGAHDMAGVRACLVRNFDKVSPDCQEAMKAVRDSKADPNAQPAPEPGPPPQSPAPHP